MTSHKSRLDRLAQAVACQACYGTGIRSAAAQRDFEARKAKVRDRLMALRNDARARAEARSLDERTVEDWSYIDASLRSVDLAALVLDDLAKQKSHLLRSAALTYLAALGDTI
jgi:hypothetical protein